MSSSQEYSIVDEFTEREPGPFKIATTGRVYRSNGPSHGNTGSISGLQREHVLNRVRLIDEKRRKNQNVKNPGWTLFASNGESVHLFFAQFRNFGFRGMCK